MTLNKKYITYITQHNILNVKGGCGVFFNFLLKVISCACLLRSGLKLIFHCNAQSCTWARLSFNSFAEASTLKATENSEVNEELCD